MRPKSAAQPLLPMMKARAYVSRLVLRPAYAWCTFCFRTSSTQVLKDLLGSSKGVALNMPPSVQLRYTIADSSDCSGLYTAENIMYDRPHDQASRWSSGKYNGTLGPSWLLLELETPSVLGEKRSVVSLRGS